jgi:hypothetical protein
LQINAAQNASDAAQLVHVALSGKKGAQTCGAPKGEALSHHVMSSCPANARTMTGCIHKGCCMRAHPATPPVCSRWPTCQLPGRMSARTAATLEHDTSALQARARGRRWCARCPHGLGRGTPAPDLQASGFHSQPAVHCQVLNPHAGNLQRCTQRHTASLGFTILCLPGRHACRQAGKQREETSRREYLRDGMPQPPSKFAALDP